MATPSTGQFSIGQFLQDVRNEARKITWPTRKDTMITTGMVIAMVIIASLFFVLSDRIILWIIGLMLGF